MVYPYLNSATILGQLFTKNNNKSIKCFCPVSTNASAIMMLFRFRFISPGDDMKVPGNWTIEGFFRIQLGMFENLSDARRATGNLPQYAI